MFLVYVSIVITLSNAEASNASKFQKRRIQGQGFLSQIWPGGPKSQQAPATLSVSTETVGRPGSRWTAVARASKNAA